MPLTETAIKAAKGESKPRKLADERGLYLLVNPNGSKLWRLKYRLAGKEKLLALGAYPDVSLRQARDRRDDARRLVAEGIDPSTKRREEKARASGADTFGAIAEAWLRHQAPAWTEGHTVTVRSRLDRDVLQVVRRVEARGAIESAHRILTVIGQVFGYAVAVGLAQGNPAAGIDRGKALQAPQPKPMAAILQPAAVGALLRAIDGYSGTHVVRCAFKLAPLVFVRPGELRAAEWSEFDLEAATWVIPAARMKLGKAMKADAGRSHIVPLSRQALDVLHEIHTLTAGGRYVFPGARSDGKPMSENAITAALRRMDYTGDQMSWHGFRSIASTLLNELGYNPDAIEAQLAHTPGNKVRAAYNRAKFLPERIRMMQDWADHLDQLKAADGTVTPFRRRAG